MKPRSKQGLVRLQNWILVSSDIILKRHPDISAEPFDTSSEISKVKERNNGVKKLAPMSFTSEDRDLEKYIEKTYRAASHLCDAALFFFWYERAITIENISCQKRPSNEQNERIVR